ncbi:MAG: TraR/DksA family transcriptional regulator [Flavobacteriales bacterium]|nr:TraR/DksA family transcriptional regulator [Flavobacteriales bacterium]
MLNAEKRKEIKSLILSTIQGVQTEIEELEELTKPIAPENAIGRVSRMDAINNKSINEAALRQTKAKLHKLEIALEKVDEDYFGLCGSCGQEIPVGRLMLMPESFFCVTCAQRR